MATARLGVAHGAEAVELMPGSSRISNHLQYSNHYFYIIFGLYNPV
jgi:hypothetical protein